MAFNGSGLFVRVRNWVVDRDAGTKIRADLHDSEDDGLATGLSTCITKDGQTTTTARIPFGSGVGLGFGTVGAPALNFTGDTDTGVYRIGANNLGVAVNGAKVLDIGTGGLGVTGNQTLTATTSSSTGVLVKGSTRFLHDYTDATSNAGNTFLGSEAGNFTMGPGGGAADLGCSNTGLGIRSLFVNTTGKQNTAVGHGSLGANTSGKENTAVGFGALSLTTGGYDNTAVGWEALGANTIGYANVAIGFGTLVAQSGGDGAVTACRNTAVGVQAMVTNTTGYSNVAIGTHALNLNTTGAFNTGLGLSAGYTNDAGNSNVFVGYQAGYGCTGSANVFLGGFSGMNAGATSSEFYLGNVQQASLADDHAFSLMYGTFAGSAGTITNQTLRINATTTIGAAGTSPGIQFNPSTSNTGLIEVHANSSIANGIAMTLFAKNNVSIADITYNSGTGGVSYNTTSDYRAKTDVREFDDPVSDVMRLKPKTFLMNAGDGTRVHGFIAHEFAEVIPWAVIGEKDALDKDGMPVFQKMDPASVIALLTAALQKALADIDELKRLIAAR